MSPLADLYSVLWQSLSINWQMSCLILLTIATMMWALKIVVLLVPGGAKARTARFLTSPMLAPTSLDRAQPLRAFPGYLLRSAACLGALFLYYWCYWKVVNAFHLRGPALSYL